MVHTSEQQRKHRSTSDYKNKRNSLLKIDRKLNPNKWKLRRKRQYDNNKQKQRDKARARRYIYKYLVLEHYSNGKMECACCGENNQFFLTIDHINNDGYLHRREVGSGSLYSWLKSHNFPKGFQVLCYNCNMVKGHYGKCLHLKKEARTF